MASEKTAVAKPARRRYLLAGAILTLALPWAAMAQTSEPAAAAPAAQPPAQPAPTAPEVPTPGTADRPQATAPPSTSQPMTAPVAPPPDGKEPAPPEKPASAWVLRPVRFATPPVIDGHLDDEIWKTAARIGDFRQLEPKEGEPATEPTEAYLGFDKDNLYIGVRCHDSEPKKIVTTTLTRDSEMTYDDTIQILLDTFHDGRSAFLFVTNSGGVHVDGLVRNEGEQINLDWDGIWTVESSRDAGGWTTEMAIPWRTLRFPSRPTQEWGFIIERLVARKQERTFWKAPKKTWYARYKLSEAPTIVGLEDAHPGSRFHFAPYVIGGIERPTDGRNSTITHAGGDVKINLTSDLVADLTVKTDFSETEADEQDVNLTRNPLLFPEKRAFFLEGASAFYAGQRPDPEHASEYFLFFSRQIGLASGGLATIPILGGVKLTGNEKGYDVGVLSVQTEATRKPDGYGGLIDEPRTTYSVVRVKRDLGNGSTFGIIGLSKDATGHQNRVGGADWDITLSKSFRTGGYVAKSSTPGVESDDKILSADVYWDSRHWRFHEEYTQVGKGFNDELGFISRTGVNAFRSDNFFILWPDGGPFKLVWLTLDLDYINDRFTGRLQTKNSHIQYNSYFKNSSGVAYKYFEQTEVLDTPFQIKRGIILPPGTYKFGHHFFGFQTDYTKPLGAAGRLAWGDYYDGKFVQSFGFIAWRPVPGLFAAATYQRTEVRLKEGDFNSDIALAEVTYAFNTRLSARAWVQWAPDANLRTKLDVDWEFWPGSRLFIVYQDLRTYINYFDPRQPVFGTPGRQLLAKAVFYF
jgi:hypothetical protein